LPSSRAPALEVPSKNRTASAEAVTLQQAQTPQAIHRTLPTVQSAGGKGIKSRRGALVGLAVLGLGGLVALWLKSNGRDAATDPSLIPSRDVAPVALAPEVSAGLPSLAPKASAIAIERPAPSAPSATASDVRPAPSAQSPSDNRPRAPRPSPVAPKRRPGKADDDIYGDR
jgi:hypothetical protein